MNVILSCKMYRLGELRTSQRLPAEAVWGLKSSSVSVSPSVSPGTSREEEAYFYNSTTHMKVEGVLLAIHWLGLVMPSFDSHKNTVSARGDHGVLVKKA